MQNQYELVDGRFVVKGKQKEEVMPSKPKVAPKQYSEEVLELKERVIRGNQKLFEAWCKIKGIVHNTKEWSAQMERWIQAKEKLWLLVKQLNEQFGFNDCLYLDENGKKIKGCLHNPDGFFCQVCPCDLNNPYWEKELMSLPSPGSKK